MTRRWPWWVFFAALIGGLLAWLTLASNPEFGGTAYRAGEVASAVGAFGGLLSAVTSWFLPSWGQRVVCFLLSLLVALGGFLSIAYQIGG